MRQPLIIIATTTKNQAGISDKPEGRYSFGLDTPIFLKSCYLRKTLRLVLESVSSGFLPIHLITIQGEMVTTLVSSKL